MFNKMYNKLPKPPSSFPFLPSTYNTSDFNASHLFQVINGALNTLGLDTMVNEPFRITIGNSDINPIDIITTELKNRSVIVSFDDFENLLIIRIKTGEQATVSAKSEITIERRYTDSDCVHTLGKPRVLSTASTGVSSFWRLSDNGSVIGVQQRCDRLPIDVIKRWHDVLGAVYSGIQTCEAKSKLPLRRPKLPVWLRVRSAYALARGQLLGRPSKVRSTTPNRALFINNLRLKAFHS